jgi:hypothetical protein
MVAIVWALIPAVGVPFFAYCILGFLSDLRRNKLGQGGSKRDGASVAGCNGTVLPTNEKS